MPTAQFRHKRVFGVNRRRLTYKERRLRYVVEWPESSNGQGK